ncbi:predicted protein [Naegleria gruberi]|uniref:Predicted protein n=1 Tax=Naegleria gruberi TaxID=5762 RepID=D2V6E3_NAEGR|nr:uncharacterized protein NAEGRDRAFT_64405 [Naegleria gruberi]EFC47556.1 predicted protein [Naegleria gruberi]|eukprot:XP_002680300.1 predicted protein [Naegleria gruberi strain NEG-M]
MQKAIIEENGAIFVPITNSTPQQQEQNLIEQFEQCLTNAEQSIKQIVASASLRDVERLTLQFRNVDEDFTSCFSVLRRVFGNQLPAVTLMEIDSQVDAKIKVQLQAQTRSGIENNGLVRFHVGERFSETAAYQGVLYISGQVPDDGTKDIEGQTEEVLAMLDARLKEAGTDKTKLLMVQIFLANMVEDFAGMNKVWDAWVPKGNTPPRATVQAQLARPEWRIEITATAAII